MTSRIRVIAVLLFGVGVAAVGLWLPEGSLFPRADMSAVGSGENVEGGTFTPLTSTETLRLQGDRRQAVRGPRRHEPYIVIDRYCNRLYYRTSDSVLMDVTCSTGSGAELVDTVSGRRWRFDTPTGVYVVHSKMENPWWRKPDWAYIEEGEPMPADDRERVDPNMMGDYAIGFGDGYYIHGTIYERLLGIAVTHGCVRLSTGDLRELYGATAIGTLIYVY